MNVLQACLVIGIIVCKLKVLMNKNFQIIYGKIFPIKLWCNKFTIISESTIGYRHE